MTTTTVPEFEQQAGIYIPGIDYPVLPMDAKLQDAVPLFGKDCTNLGAAANRLAQVTIEHELDRSREYGTTIAYGSLTDDEVDLVDEVLIETLKRRSDVRNLEEGIHHDGMSRIMWDYDRLGRHYTFGRIAGPIALASVAPIRGRIRTIYPDGWTWSLRSSSLGIRR